MHQAVRDWVVDHLPDTYSSVLEIGSLDINGGIRDLLDPRASYLGIDVQAGPGVDLVADATKYMHDWRVDVVLCLEVFEHTSDWPEIIKCAACNIKSGGWLIVTCATNSRAPHSGVDGGRLRPGEWYENVIAADLLDEMQRWFGDSAIDVVGNDLRGWATR